MCLIAWAWNRHPRYLFILAANRDEFHHRPSAPAAFWSDFSQVLAGRDLEQMGTWLGITTSGRLAALTNVREPGRDDANALSRGDLVRAFLCGEASPLAYVNQVQEQGHLYNGFNLVVGDLASLAYCSNRGPRIDDVAGGPCAPSAASLDTSLLASGGGLCASSAASLDTSLLAAGGGLCASSAASLDTSFLAAGGGPCAPSAVSLDTSLLAVTSGIHAMSNASLDTPWPKVVQAKAWLAALCEASGFVDPQAILELLADAHRPPDEDLPDTGVGLEWERELAPIFVSTPTYGTRVSTVITVERSGAVTFLERTHPGELDRLYHFQLSRLQHALGLPPPLGGPHSGFQGHSRGGHGRKSPGCCPTTAP